MEQFEEINLKHILKVIFSKLGYIIALTLIVGIIAFVYSETMVETKYESKISMYVNNESNKSMNKVLGSDITASQMLVDTYIVMIKSNTVLDEVSNILEQSGIKGYDAEKLRGCITAKAIDETEVFEVKVKGTDPHQTYIIANVIADASPKLIQTFVEASSIKIVDYAVEGERVSPNVKKNTALGLIIGFVLACLLALIIDLFDTRIKEEEQLKLWSLPVLGAIPNMFENEENSSDGFKESYKRKGREKNGATKNA